MQFEQITVNRDTSTHKMSLWAILPLIAFMAGIFMLNAHRQNGYKEVILTTDIGNGCLREGRRVGFGGLFTQTAVAL